MEEKSLSLGNDIGTLDSIDAFIQYMGEWSCLNIVDQRRSKICEMGWAIGNSKVVGPKGDKNE